jgi:hypothetical protein
MQQYQQLIKVKSQNMSKLGDFDFVGKFLIWANKFEPGKKKGIILLQGLKIENFSHHKQTMLSILAGIPGHNHQFYNFNHWITQAELAVVNCSAIGFVGL